ncbi:universal stress protein [Mucilaginibacter xinganensis]|uniref:Universal stress protein n=1 Tax=Mucilaginibacter xinganensis TaxID=1234841 RepID=A0A223NUL2_9SPHI|nr:universal stress protein [Mucilaginibacter xinganensis]ASU33364.1 Universal stress protein [Mucilaginibacter xinganensis]
MKNILILTDFSENAAGAATFGAYLGSKLHANIVIFNSYLKFSEALSYAGGSWVADDVLRWREESKLHVNQLAESLEQLVALHAAATEKPMIHCHSAEGNLGDNLVDIIKEKNIDLIVMGARTGTAIEHVFWGSDTATVIQHSTRPVLVVPAKTDIQNITKVVFATDFEDADKKALQYLEGLGEIFHFKLEIIHITPPGDDNKDEKKSTFTHWLSQLEYPYITYKEISGTDVVEKLNSLCTTTNSELLAMVHHQHSFFVRLLHESTTKRALLNQKIPIMVFPSSLE